MKPIAIEQEEGHKKTSKKQLKCLSIFFFFSHTKFNVLLLLKSIYISFLKYEFSHLLCNFYSRIAADKGFAKS